MSQGSKQAVCKNCKDAGIYHEISWNETARANLQTRKPLNMDGTIHNCPNYNPQGSIKTSNPSSYNPQSGIQPIPQYSPSTLPQQQQTHHIVSNPISSSLTQEEMVEKMVSMEEKMSAMSAKMDAMYTIVHEYITYNPVAATLTQFITDIIRGKEDQLPGPISADKISRGSTMGSEDINSLPQDDENITDSKWR